MDNGNGQEGWTEDDVQGVLLNPIHTMGSDPQIEDESWIDAQKKLLAEMGNDQYFRKLLTVIQDTFNDVVE